MFILRRPTLPCPDPRREPYSERNYARIVYAARRHMRKSMGTVTRPFFIATVSNATITVIIYRRIHFLFFFFCYVSFGAKRAPDGATTFGLVKRK